MEKVKITTEYIKLEQAMKYTGLAESGAQAKMIIGSGDVTVNGVVQLQRGKKLRPGDILEYKGKSYIIS